jgi:hypothetical protein
MVCVVEALQLLMAHPVATMIFAQLVRNAPVGYAVVGHRRIVTIRIFATASRLVTQYWIVSQGYQHQREQAVVRVSTEALVMALGTVAQGLQ